jgi:cytochrome c553
MAQFRSVLGCAAAAALAGAAWAAPGYDWAFPGKGATGADASKVDPWVRLPGSSVRYRASVIRDGAVAIDWRPREHAPLPAALARAQPPSRYACGYCHLPGGEGRPENASLAGLPADYIQRQVAAFASGERKGVRPDWGPTAGMIGVARSTRAADVAAAAAYFSKRRFVSHLRVVETDAAPATVARAFVDARVSGRPAPLGPDRIVEGPVSMDRFELRDPHVGYIAYVPRGAIARGAALARSGGPAGQACSACHGSALQGALGPPLAGRSPTYIVRQLLSFKAGSRRSPAAAPMIPVAKVLSQSQMVDLAAYAASSR